MYLPDTANTAPTIERFFDRVSECFAEAAARVGTTHYDLAIGGRVVRLVLAGCELYPVLVRALAHLALPPQPTPDITLCLWEIAGSGVALPPPPWDAGAFSYRGEVRGFNDSVRFTTYHPDGRILFVYDAARRHGFVSVFDGALLPVYEQAAPLRPILSAALGAFNIQYAHAAAVGLPGGGVVLAGKSGAGKSTTSLACLDSELLFAGDDYCALDAGPLDDGRADRLPNAYSLYHTAKASAATIARLPYLEPLIELWDTQGSAKAIFFLQEQLPHKLISHFPIRAIMIPRITGARDTHVAPATARAAMLALAPSTYNQLPAADQKVLERLARIARRVPAFYLDVGSDMAQIPGQILRQLAQLESA